MTYPGLFIVIEGIDGTGKTELLRRLAPKIELKTGVRIIQRHEPGSCELEGTIRRLFKRESGPLPSEAMAVLFTADRLLCMDRFSPLLSDGLIVVSDRHKLSTLAYQAARGCSMDVLSILNSVPCPEPDLTILLTIDPNVARQRMIARNPELDSYEADLDAQHRIQELYLANITSDALVIDASIEPGAVADIAADLICEMIVEKGLDKDV